MLQETSRYCPSVLTRRNGASLSDSACLKKMETSVSEVMFRFSHMSHPIHPVAHIRPKGRAKLPRIRFPLDYLRGDLAAKRDGIYHRRFQQASDSTEVSSQRVA